MKEQAYLFTKEHEWLAKQENTNLIGLSAYAVEQLGDIVYVELPKKGARFKKGDSFGTVESTKTVSDIYMPNDGEITEVNQSVIDDPQLIEKDPYGQGWLVRIRQEGVAPTGLLSFSEYQSYIKA